MLPVQTESTMRSHLGGAARRRHFLEYHQFLGTAVDTSSLQEAMANGVGLTDAKAARMATAMEPARRVAWKDLTTRLALPVRVSLPRF